jgi:hypothetical protein
LRVMGIPLPSADTTRIVSAYPAPLDASPNTRAHSDGYQS